jgi:hypothetical protein
VLHEADIHSAIGWIALHRTSSIARSPHDLRHLIEELQNCAIA